MTQWIRWKDWHEPSLGLWYWRDQGGNEVDLLLERDQQLFAVECKLSEHPDKKAVQGIKRLKKFYGDEQIAYSYITCPVNMSFDIEQGVTAVSGWKTWEHRVTTTLVPEGHSQTATPTANVPLGRLTMPGVLFRHECQGYLRPVPPGR